VDSPIASSECYSSNRPTTGTEDANFGDLLDEVSLFHIA